MLTKAKAREYIQKLFKVLELEPIKVIFLSRGTSSPNLPHVRIGQFNVGAKGPYITIWRDGMNRETIRHEVIHYLQYTLHGNAMFSTGYREGEDSDGDPTDPYELEAYSLEGLAIKNLRRYAKFRRSFEYKN